MVIKQHTEVWLQEYSNDIVKNTKKALQILYSDRVMVNSVTFSIYSKSKLLLTTSTSTSLGQDTSIFAWVIEISLFPFNFQ
jgi:hypothetical protein